MKTSWVVNGAVFLLSGLALAISLYIIAKVGGHHSLPGCGEGGCNQVVTGRWGRWGGLSLASLGVGGYAALMAGAIVTAGKRFRALQRVVWSLMVIEALSGIGFVVWLILLQWLVIHQFCVFCLSSHLFGIAAYGVVLWWAPVWRALPHARLTLGGSAGAILAILISVHILVVPDMMAVEAAGDIEVTTLDGSETAAAGGVVQFGKRAKSRTVQLLDDALTFDLYTVPVLGNREAEHVLLELSDYCCPSCRKLHSRMHQFLEKHAVDLAIVYLPAPMSPDCNPNISRTPPGFEDACTLARYGMAVNKADPEQFPAIHNFMMAGSAPPSVEAVRAKAEALVGREAFNTALNAAAVDEWIAAGAGIQGYIKATTIPKLITRTQVISYSGGSRAGFEKLMKEALGTDVLHGADGVTH